MPSDRPLLFLARKVCPTPMVLRKSATSHTVNMSVVHTRRKLPLRSVTPSPFSSVTNKTPSVVLSYTLSLVPRPVHTCLTTLGIPPTPSAFLPVVESLTTLPCSATGIGFQAIPLCPERRGPPIKGTAPTHTRHTVSPIAGGPTFLLPRQVFSVGVACPALVPPTMESKKA